MKLRLCVRDQIREAMSAGGWRVNEIAQAIGVSRTTVWRFFAGRSELHPLTLDLLLTCVGMTILIENGEVTLVRRES